jgi:hypothetical protein
VIGKRLKFIEAARKSSWAPIAEVLDLSSLLGVLGILLGSSRASGRRTNTKVRYTGDSTGITGTFWIHESEIHKSEQNCTLKLLAKAKLKTRKNFAGANRRK